MLLGGRCEFCEFNDSRALQVDHKDGHGRRVDPTRHPHKLLSAIVRNPDRYQLLCANCNWIKKADNEEVRGMIEEEN
jgi:hypothetical protein